MTDEQIDAIFNAHEEAPTRSYRYLVARAIIAASASTQPVAQMPAYGQISWGKLIAAVGEANGAPWTPDDSYYIGHQPAPINMNSLNRIVSMFAPPQSTAPINAAAQGRRQGNPAVTGSQPTPYESLIDPAAAAPSKPAGRVLLIPRIDRSRTNKNELLGIKQSEQLAIATASEEAMQDLMFPNTIKLVREKHIKLYLGPCKIVATLEGFCLVSPIFGAGYFGSFDRAGRFWPSKECKQEHIELLQRVEDKGLAAVAEIGLLTGICGICGRILTAEESIAGGIGPICAGKVGYALDPAEF